jgi:putative ABC transport system substrate-binding protein
MERRAFVVGALSLLAAPLAAEAQPAAKVARIGLLANNPAANPHLLEAFLQGLRDLGYVEGRNLVIERRYAEGKLERYPALAAELVALKVDVIVAGNPSFDKCQLNAVTGLRRLQQFETYEIRYQASGLDQLRVRVHRRQAILRGELHDPS